MSVPVVPVHFCKARRVIEHDLARTTVPSPTGEARYSRHRLTFTPGTAVVEVPRRTGHPRRGTSATRLARVAYQKGDVDNDNQWLETPRRPRPARAHPSHGY